MGKVVVYSDVFLPTFPQLELPLYRELSAQVETRFVLQDHDYRLVTPGLSEVFAPLTTSIPSPKKDLLDLVGREDLCVLRFGYKGLVGEVASILRSKGRRVLMLDPAAIDLKHRECLAQWVTAKSEWMRQCVMKKFPGRYKSVFSTGTLHFDSAFGLGPVDKRALMESYGLNPDKKLAVLTPANPAEGNPQQGVNDEYAAIAKVVRGCPEYELVVKAHPSDYVAKLPALPGIIHKHEFHHGAYSWESFAPGVKVVRAAEGYEALSCADVVLNVRSSIAMEVPFFGTPLLNVNRGKYETNWPDSSNTGVMRDIKLEELERVLKDGKFEVDVAAREEYALKYCDPCCDGHAYKRIVTVAVDLLDE